MRKNTIATKIGLMHLIATNLCEWLFTLVQETKRDIFKSAEKQQEAMSKANQTLQEVNLQFLRSKSFQLTKQLYEHNSKCLNSTIMDSVLKKMEPYLGPCCVEYSFLSSVMLCMMWKYTYENETSSGRLLGKRNIYEIS